jgi:hypothetical protein
MGDANVVPQPIVVRRSEVNRREAVRASYSQIVAELKAELADGAEVACICCAAKFCNIKGFGAIIIWPASEDDGHIGAACNDCALASTDDDLVRVFQAERSTNC